MEKILYASMEKVTGPNASQFYSVHVFFFTQSLLYCRHSNTHKILVFSVSRLKIDFLANVSWWEMKVGQQYFSLGFPTCQNKSALTTPRPRSTLSLNSHYLPKRQSFFRGSTHNDVRWINGFWLYKAFGHGFRHIPSSEKANICLEFARHLDSSLVPSRPTTTTGYPRSKCVSAEGTSNMVAIMNRFLNWVTNDSW